MASMEVGFLRKEDRKTHIWLGKKWWGGGEEMWNKADREEKHPHLNSQECLNSRCFFCLPGLYPGCALYPRNLFCTICISPKYSFHLPVCSGVIPAWHSPPGPCCRTEALREVRQAALLLHHCFSFPLHSPFSTVQGCQTPSEAPNII